MEKTPYQLRKERALNMAQAGIEPAIDGENIFGISSQFENGKKYKIEMKGSGWCDCSCPDNKKGNLCKHIILLKLWLQSRENKVIIEEETTITEPCPFCGLHNMKKDGTRKTTMGKKQRWFCKACGKRFVLEPIKNIKGNVDAVILSMDLYMKGVSYRGIQDTLRQFFGLKITHVTVMRWVKEFTSKISEHVASLVPEVGDNWMADEQFTKIGGKMHYIWNCMDERTRFLLANRVSPTRKTHDARKLFQDAKNTAQKRAKTVTTDGAFSYNKAVRKEFYTKHNQKPHRQYVSIRDKHENNNKIERYHGSYRQRDKTFRGHKTLEGTDTYSENYRAYYNFLRPHIGLDGFTPAQAAGLNVKAEWKDLLLKSLSS